MRQVLHKPHKLHRGWRLLKVLIFISSSALHLARDWNGLKKVPSKSVESFDESTSSSSWINGIVAFTGLRKTKFFFELVNQLLEENLSQVKDFTASDLRFDCVIKVVSAYFKRPEISKVYYLIKSLASTIYFHLSEPSSY